MLSYSFMLPIILCLSIFDHHILYILAFTICEQIYIILFMNCGLYLVNVRSIGWLPRGHIEFSFVVLLFCSRLGNKCSFGECMSVFNFRPLRKQNVIDRSTAAIYYYCAFTCVPHSSPRILPFRDVPPFGLKYCKIFVKNNIVYIFILLRVLSLPSYVPNITAIFPPQSCS